MAVPGLPVVGFGFGDPIEGLGVLDDDAAGFSDETGFISGEQAAKAKIELVHAKTVFNEFIATRAPRLAINATLQSE